MLLERGEYWLHEMVAASSSSSCSGVMLCACVPLDTISSREFMVCGSSRSGCSRAAVHSTAGSPIMLRNNPIDVLLAGTVGVGYLGLAVTPAVQRDDLKRSWSGSLPDGRDRRGGIEAIVDASGFLESDGLELLLDSVDALVISGFQEERYDAGDQLIVVDESLAFLNALGVHDHQVLLQHTPARGV